MSRNRLLTLLTAIALAAPSLAGAENRRGTSLSLAGGVGSSTVKCDGCVPRGAHAGPSGELALAWSLTDRLMIGASFDVWSGRGLDGSTDTSTRTILNTISGTVAWYPAASGGFFIRGGIGAAVVNQDIRPVPVHSVVDFGSGLGLIASAGYEIRTGGRWLLVPSVQLRHGWPGSLRDEASVVERNFQFTALAATLGITFR
jgi:hypothetical protein